MDTTNKGRTVFGREPAAFSALVTTALTMLLSFGFGITPETYAPIVAIVIAGLGVYTAWGTTETALAGIVTFFKAGAVLTAVYGFSLSDTQVAATVAVIVSLGSFYLRTQTSPLDANGDVLVGDTLSTVTPVVEAEEPLI